MLLRSLPVFLLLASAAPEASAATFRCQTKGFCTNSVSCKPDDAVLTARTLPGGRMQFGWEENDTRFVGDPIRKQNITVYVSTQANDRSVQTFTLANNMQATMSVMSYFQDQLYHSIQSLTCVETSK
ncbi:MAG: hypothetical protein AAF748_11355 [Pseudomonadota bacterium]